MWFTYQAFTAYGYIFKVKLIKSSVLNNLKDDVSEKNRKGIKKVREWRYK